MLLTGLALAIAALVLTHPAALALVLFLALVFVHRSGASARHPLLLRLALGLALSVALFNALFSWNGATVLYRAPFRIVLLGRPLLTLEAIAWGLAAGAQLAATTLALGAATLVVAPESLHRGLARIGLPRTLASAASLGLRFVPDTGRDAAAMRRALRVRGVETGGVRGAAHVLVPLSARALDRGLIAEEAMVLRGYGDAPGRGPARRWARPSPVTLLGLGSLTATAFLALLGPGRAAYYPTVEVALAAPALVAILVALLPLGILVQGVRRSSP